MEVVKHGLLISEHGDRIIPFRMPNYSSVTDHMPEFLHNLSPELLAGRVVQVQSVQFANAVGLIPKSNSVKMRQITDLSRPVGASVNNSIPDRHFKFQTLEVAMSLMSKGCYMATLDIRHAYRHIVINSKDWDLQSFIVGEKCYQDRCLSFGLKITPEVFTRFTQAVVQMMKRRGFHNLMAYLDEFFIAGTMAVAWHTICALISLLLSLGFYIHWRKLILPVQCLKFLGFILDSRTMEVLSLRTSWKMQPIY